jgi:flagella basal body P-ring formation protein FlgA
MIPFVMLLPFLAATGQAPSCHAVSGERITAADIAAVLPAFQSVAPEAVIGYAPQPGSYRTFEPAELTRFAAANGMSYSGLATVCFEPALAELDPAQIQTAIRQSLKTLAITEADIDVVEYSKFPVPPGKLSFPVESLPGYSSANVAIWNGFVEKDNHRYPVWARVRIAVPQTRVVAATNLRAGEKVGASDIRLEETRVFPTRVAPLKSSADCVGLLARRYLATGTAVSPADLMEPFDVNRGDIVTVEVQSGGAVLKLDAEAQAAGRTGQSIAFRNATSGKVFHALITGKGRALLDSSSPGNEK